MAEKHRCQNCEFPARYDKNPKRSTLTPEKIMVDVYNAHRREIEALKAEIQGSTVQLVTMSYPELWEEWSYLHNTPWLKGHIKKLRDRYFISV
jgi:2-iminoacetate synthase ThiH